MSLPTSWMGLKTAAPQESSTAHRTPRVRREMRYKAVLVDTACFEIAGSRVLWEKTTFKRHCVSV